MQDTPSSSCLDLKKGKLYIFTELWCYYWGDVDFLDSCEILYDEFWILITQIRPCWYVRSQGKNIVEISKWYL